jgi:hypothetical protein
MRVALNDAIVSQQWCEVLPSEDTQGDLTKQISTEDTMKREIKTHEVNGLNACLRITVLDEQGHGNACHKYEIGWGSAPDDISQANPCYIKFQDGPINEVGVNGISHEALLAIVQDRLEGFQSGPYSCESNWLALEAIKEAIDALQTRTKERTDRGVEGTHEV